MDALQSTSGHEDTRAPCLWRRLTKAREATCQLTCKDRAQIWSLSLSSVVHPHRFKICSAAEGQFLYFLPPFSIIVNVFLFASEERPPSPDRLSPIFCFTTLKEYTRDIVRSETQEASARCQRLLWRLSTHQQRIW